MSRRKPILVSLNTPSDTIRFVETILDKSSDLLTHFGQTQQQAAKMSREIVIETCRMLGGKLLYISKNIRVEAQQRRQQIRDEFNQGTNKKDLSVKYQLTSRQIHAICHEIKDTVPAKATTKEAGFIAIVATRMFMKSGVNATDAANAARDLLALLTAKFCGKQILTPCGNNLVRILRMIDVQRLCITGYSYLAAEHYSLTLDQITEILAAYPAATLPDITDLPKIKTRLFNYSKAFSDYSEVSEILHETAERISRAEEIISRLKG